MAEPGVSKDVLDEAPALELDAEQQLVRAAQQGDTRAFEELIRTYRRRILWIAYKIVGNEEDALDVCQDVSIRLFRFLHRYDPKYRFFTWLYRLVVNASIDHVNRRKRRPSKASLDELGERAPALHEDPAPGPDQAAEAAEIRRLIQTVLADLTPQQRTAFLLRDVEGLAPQEVAEAMNCTQGTVRTHLHFARKRIRRAIETRFPDWRPGGVR